MTVAELCAAVVTKSDNAAANVLLNGIGGPQGFTQFMRSLGDKITRLDRKELDLNENRPGDERDTTTPRAMVDSMLRIFTQDVLSLASRALLIDWMSQASTGLDRVRAGLPKSWPSGERTPTTTAPSPGRPRGSRSRCGSRRAPRPSRPRRSPRRKPRSAASCARRRSASPRCRKRSTSSTGASWT